MPGNETLTRLIKPYLSYAEVEESFRSVLDSGIFTRGENVEAFAHELARYVGTRHAHLTTSATTALSLCLTVLGVKPGDEVIVSDFSFPASANVVETAGARPVFCDVDPNTYNMAPAHLEERLSPRTKAVMFVDALGNPTGVHDIREICARRGVPLIEDAACALGSSENGERCGAVADLTCFSFHPRKLLTTGEGGAISAHDPALATQIGLLLNHGGQFDHKTGQLDFIAPGFNYRMSELQAVMGRLQLQKLDTIIARRQAMRDEFAFGLEPLGFTPQATGDCVSHNVQSLVFTVPQGCDRNALCRHLGRLDIESTIGTYCLSGTTYYKTKYQDVQSNAQALARTTITLPCHDDVDTGAVIEAVASFPDLRRS